MSDKTESTYAGLDPWYVQREMMEISGQHLPDRYEVNRSVVLYAALIMEELGEFFEALAVLTPDRSNGLGVRFQGNAAALHAEALSLRRALETSAEELRRPLSAEQAVPLADALTDLAVVVCGAAESAGLPGALCYAEVAESNLSKADPESGLIVQDAGGKWIKGRNYRAPDLLAVLRAYRGTGELK